MVLKVFVWVFAPNMDHRKKSDNVSRLPGQQRTAVGIYILYIKMGFYKRILAILKIWKKIVQRYTTKIENVEGMKIYFLVSITCPFSNEQ